MPKRILPLVPLLVLASASISCAALSGQVIRPGGAGFADVDVALASGAYAASASGDDGTWTLSATTSLSGAGASSTRPDGLVLENGRLRLLVGGVGVDGRRRGSVPAIEALPSGSAARAAAAVDTLLFSVGGTVRARLPVGTLDSSGIVVRIDTATLDAGTTTTTWATSCPDQRNGCVSGSWTASGPDPDHSDYSLVKQSSHFAIYSDETIADSLATLALSVLEDSVWARFFGSTMQMVEPLCSLSTKPKVSVHVHSDWGLTGGAWSSTRMGMWIGPGALADHWGLAHEFTHAVQSVAGGLACNDSNTCGWIYESHANWTPHQLPEYASEVHCSEMLPNLPHLYLGSTRDRYCNWQFMEYLKDKECPSAVNAIWEKPEGDDPFEKIMSTRGWGVSEMNDFLGEWATHNVTWDYQTSGPGFRSGYGTIVNRSTTERLRRLTQLEALDSSWTSNRRFVSPFYGAPQRWGYNVIRLHPQSGAKSVAVTFRGVLQDGSNADFRWGLVATNSTYTTSRYSALQSGTDGHVRFSVGTGDSLFLVVMATPSKYRAVVWDEAWGELYRYPYMVELDSAWPEGFRDGSLDACPTGLSRHANGGGCAPSSTPSTVYVGPHARILSTASASGTARIEDEAVVAYGTVSDEAVVGGLSTIGQWNSTYGYGNSFAVSDSAQVFTSLYPLGFYEASQSVSGTAKLVGDVEYRGTSLSIASGTYSGFVDESTASMTDQDPTTEGPYTWRE